MNSWIRILIVVLAIYPIILLFVVNLINHKKSLERRNQIENMLNNLKVNDYIITISGIYGTIKSLNENLVELEIAKDVVIKLDKSCIVAILNK